MTTKVVSCCHCRSEKLKKNGFAPNGKQKYWCKACGKASRKKPSAKGYSKARQEEVLVVPNR